MAPVARTNLDRTQLAQRLPLLAAKQNSLRVGLEELDPVGSTRERPCKRSNKWNMKLEAKRRISAYK
ncbi:hypothetical protein AAFF_G00348110 [Aldrovandia affinis]|uniref:Uncharacterized protein n=1 Tax=Aldrovandia affinis TaxID=143900 RepID=A0AAD7VZQ4_9TELE|nr:hypothetical protein AAFF_G00348110 [Aldrovandia affinis]